MNKVIRVLLILMILFSFVTHTLDSDADNFVIARMTFSDIFGLLAILFVSIDFVNRKFPFSEVPRGYWVSIGLVLVLLISIVDSLAPGKTVAEILILGYLVLIFYSIYTNFKRSLNTLFTVLIFTTGIMSAIGIYDILAVNLDWATLFIKTRKIEGISGFRNMGQAANFAFTMLSLLIPWKYSKNVSHYSSLKLWLLNTVILSTTIFMFTTGRISIILSFIVGFVFFLVMHREKRIFKDVSVLGIIGSIFLVIIYRWAPLLFGNLVYRFQSRITHRDINTLEGSFIVDNFTNSLDAFGDNIFFGTGLGAFVNNYSDVEIHGTYLKMLGETGLIGTLGYVLFFIFFTFLIYRNYRNDSSNFFKYILPFFLASIVAWSYNYHLRKKEFWVLFAVLMIFNEMRISTKKEYNEE